MHWQKNAVYEISSTESSLKALTPEGVEFVLSPAGLPVRTFAYAIDRIFQWIILLAIQLSYIFILSDATGIWFTLILFFLVDWFYHVICELAFRGQTPGKRLMGIRVVKNDGSPVDPASSFLRNLLRFADTFFSLFHIAFISIAASRGFRRLGDWAGGTLVVYSAMAKNSMRGFLSSYQLEKFEPASPERPLSTEEKQAILNFARRYPLLGEARADEIAGIYAPSIKNDSCELSNSAFLMGIARKLSGEI